MIRNITKAEKSRKTIAAPPSQRPELKTGISVLSSSDLRSEKTESRAFAPISSGLGFGGILTASMSLPSKVNGSFCVWAPVALMNTPDESPRLLNSLALRVASMLSRIALIDP